MDQMSAAELVQFTKFKENQYAQRRARIEEFCKNILQPQMLEAVTKPRHNSIIYDPEHNLAYCQIAKVNYFAVQLF